MTLLIRIFVWKKKVNLSIQVIIKSKLCVKYQDQPEAKGSPALKIKQKQKQFAVTEYAKSIQRQMMDENKWHIFMKLW